MTAPDNRMPTLYIPHGGGPCFFMEPTDNWDPMGDFLRSIDSSVAPRPSCVLVISGHWEEAVPTVNVASAPPLLFDYYGFPEHTYRLTYPAPGSPEVAGRVRALLAEAGIESGEEASRGLDHGVFVPFLLIYPDADIPVVQLSLHWSLDAGVHLAIGRALAPLRDEGVLIIGSGMSFHNNAVFRIMDDRIDQAAGAFDDWLTASVEEPDPATRDLRLMGWQDAPFATFCHPRPEHLTPLFVAAGAAAGDPGARVFNDRVLGKAVSAFRFG